MYLFFLDAKVRKHQDRQKSWMTVNLRISVITTINKYIMKNAIVSIITDNNGIVIVHWKVFNLYHSTTIR